MTRKLTVLEPALGIPGSELRMRGAWVRAAGFEPGARVQVVVTSPGVLEVRALAEVPATAGQGSDRISRQPV